MTKQEHIERIESRFGNVTKFYKLINKNNYAIYKNPAQSAYSYRKSKKIDPAIARCFEFYEMLQSVERN